MQRVFPFTGRVRRLDFVLRVFAFILLTTIIDPRLSALTQAVFIVLSIALIAAFAGRLRDAGFSPWFCLVVLVPVIGWLFMLVFMIWEGRR